MEHNTVFYRDCTRYLGALRRQGRHDDGFEDEYYYTMPGMSSSE